MPVARWKPTDEQIQMIETLAGYGLTQTQIAHAMGIKPRTFRYRKAYLPEVAEAVDAGIAKAAGTVAQALFRKAKDGDVRAIQWWEMTRLKRRPMQAEGDDGSTTQKVSVVDFEVVEYDDGSG
jgi:hypothetical protein